MVILWQDYCGKRQFEKILLKHGWEKTPNWECLFVHREKGFFLSVYVDDMKLAGKKQNLDPMWKVLDKEVDLGEPTSFLDHVYLGCTQRQCETSKDIVDNYRTMFESRYFRGENRKNHTLKIFVFLHGQMQEHTSIIHIFPILEARRPMYVRLALWFLHRPAWVKGHTGGSRLTPTVHPC